MSPADYFDWWHYSGTGLGMDSPGETYERLRAELSPAGAVVVIVSRFLVQNPDAIDVARWRRDSVFGRVGTQVALTAEALEAIGASGAARAVREGKGHRPILPDLADLARGGDLDQETARAAIDQLRESIRSRAAMMLGDVGGITPAKPTEGVESRDEIGRLLDAFAESHGEELAGDVARHGDPRRAPGFDPDRAMEERAERARTIAFLRYQERELAGLLSDFAAFTAAADEGPPDSERVQNYRRQVMNDYANYAKHPPEKLTPEVGAWLDDVRAFRDARRDVFHPDPTKDARVNARLAAIGPYNISFFMNSPSLTWHDLPALACDWSKLSLHFDAGLRGKREPEPTALAAAFDALADAWDEFRAGFPFLLTELRQYLIDEFRSIRADQLSDEERPEYLGHDREIADGKILEAVEDGSIALQYDRQAGVQTTIHVGVRWDEEHGVELTLDEYGQIQRWF